MKSEAISKYAKKIREIGYKSLVDDRLLVKIDGTCYISKAGADFDELTGEDFIEVPYEYMTEAAVLTSIKNLEALLISAPKYCKLCVERGTAVVAVMDDFAQIIGHKAPVLKRTARRLASALKSDSAVLVSTNESAHGYAIAAGRNPYEAVVAMTVLEKSAEIVIKAEVLGGAKELGRLIVTAQRRKYLNRYSRAEGRRSHEKK